MSETSDERLRPDTAKVLGGLKDFQRNTVEHVFRRLYLDADFTRRFLVADEVGLGKTLIARGVIAKAIDHLWDRTDRIDIVYVCSNADIARQNVARLNVTDCNDFSFPSRITLLPITLTQMNPRLNFISFTPGTSFDLQSSAGMARERALIYWMLKDSWNLQGAMSSRPFQVKSTREGFQWDVDYVRDQCEIHPGMANAFAAAVALKPDLRKEYERLLELVPPRRDIPLEIRQECARWIGELRRTLAETCLHWLEPDLIILDEFQRFKHLLNGHLDKAPEAAQLAEFLFSFQQNSYDPATAARVLLLSATPYKMYTRSHEKDDDDHHADFLTTLRFLLQAPGSMESFQQQLREYREGLFRLADSGTEKLIGAKSQIESMLRKVIARTERLALRADRNGMLREVPTTSIIKPSDLQHYLGLQRVARSLEHDDTIEYWKSAPYLLNFMEDYSLKKKLKERFESGIDPHLSKSVRSLRTGLLDRDQLERYERLDPANARLRSLYQDTIGCESWRLLWIPPSLPYYGGTGPFADPKLKSFTKRLVFSCWKVVPKAIASVLSYEAERNMMHCFRRRLQNTIEARKRRRGLLRFSFSKGKPTGMPVLGMLYPCKVLAESIDPMRFVEESADIQELPSQANVLFRVKIQVKELLGPILHEFSNPDESTDENWYWAAPLLLDLDRNSHNDGGWLAACSLATAVNANGNDDDTSAGWKRHVDLAEQLVSGSLSLGAPPEDLLDVLTKFAVGGPGVASLRALRRILPPPSIEPDNLGKDATSLAHAFVHLFNLPEVTYMVRDRDKERPYWQSVLDYCVSGNLQAVLDEYVHILIESLGLADSRPELAVKGVTEVIVQALTLRTATAKADIISTTGRQARLDDVDALRFRTRFAMRFGDQEPDDGTKEQTRADHVRTAFNSPFWPFVLASTSVGQEGLDFHPYCHAIVHWNLPSNPVDLEQREGRIHRYKGHALRKNIAAKFRYAASDAAPDPWAAMFHEAKQTRSNATDLFPYWISPGGEASIERYVLAHPHSKEIVQHANLRRSLVLYRMVFGQSRQDDLLEYLNQRHSPEEVERIAEECRIDLSPPDFQGELDAAMIHPSAELA